MDAPLEPFRNLLSLKHKWKPVPYFGDGTKRPDGQANHGFKLLKGKPDLLSKIPELADDPALRGLVEAINRPDTGLFSIGCLSEAVDDEGGKRRSGYVEFALNSKTQIADAQNYFPLFFHFDFALHTNNFADGFAFGWEISPVSFYEAKANGFCCAIFLNTFYFATDEEVMRVWNRTLGILGEYLSTAPNEPDGLICGEGAWR